MRGMKTEEGNIPAKIPTERVFCMAFERNFALGGIMYSNNIPKKIF